MARIPNLTPDLYRPATRNTAPVPTLVRCHCDRHTGEFDFEWEALGYRMECLEVTAFGRLSMTDNCQVRWRGMEVYCSCKSFEEISLMTEESGWRVLFVCKHLKAALDSVCDVVPENEEQSYANEEEEKVMDCDSDMEAAAPVPSGRTTLLAIELERLEKEVFAQSDRAIVKVIRERMGSEDGLEALSILFPSEHCAQGGESQHDHRDDKSRHDEDWTRRRPVPS